MKNYILNGKIPVVELDIIKWGEWYGSEENKHVDITEFDGVRISTVFLGFDHCCDGGEPILFETMIFGGEYDQYQDRYTTWEEAEKGHKEAINLVLTT